MAQINSDPNIFPDKKATEVSEPKTWGGFNVTIYNFEQSLEAEALAHDRSLFTVYAFFTAPKKASTTKAGSDVNRSKRKNKMLLVPIQRRRQKNASERFFVVLSNFKDLSRPLWNPFFELFLSSTDIWETFLHC